MEVSIRSGGHSVPGFGVCEGGLMIDLSAMIGGRVDATRRTARAQAGATWGDFDHETHAYGMATTGGVMRTTGIAGLTLAGGHGVLMRKYGLACDNLQSVDMVTADGRVVMASEDENQDLFWGLRGGGGNFGIVTSFEYRLHPVRMVTGGLLAYPLEQAPGVLRAYDDYMSAAREELGTIGVLGTLPDGTKVAGCLLSYCGPLEEAEAAIRPLKGLGTLLLDRVAPMPYTAVQSIAENFNPCGMRNYWKNSYVAVLSDDAIRVVVDYHRRSPHPLTHQVIYTLGGEVARLGANTAVGHRDARHSFTVFGIWEDAERDAQNIAYVRNLWSEMQPHSSGGFYPNYDATAGTSEIQAAFGAEKYARLVALKRKCDPDNFFRLNQNINPA
jgi:FAD/FMN-containing dehydrogenase